MLKCSQCRSLVEYKLDHQLLSYHTHSVLMPCTEDYLMMNLGTCQCAMENKQGPMYWGGGLPPGGIPHPTKSP